MQCCYQTLNISVCMNMPVVCMCVLGTDDALLLPDVLFVGLVYDKKKKGKNKGEKHFHFPFIGC